MKDNIPAFLLSPQESTPHASVIHTSSSYIEKALHGFSGVFRLFYFQWDSASKNGFMQKLDARVKIIMLLFYLVMISFTRDIIPLVLLFGFVTLILLITKLNFVHFIKFAIIPGLLFGFLGSLPASFNFITKGEIIFNLFTIPAPYKLWIYTIPATVGITREGLKITLILSMRVITSLSFSYLILYTSTFQELIKALKVLKVPDMFLMTITLAYKYIFLFANTVTGFYFSRKSRSGSMNRKGERQWAAGRMGYLFTVVQKRYNEIYDSMVSRGYEDSERKFSLSGFRRLKSLDIVSGCLLVIPGIILLFIK